MWLCGGLRLLKPSVSDGQAADVAAGSSNDDGKGSVATTKAMSPGCRIKL